MMDILILAFKFPIAKLSLSNWVTDKYSFKIVSIPTSLYSIPSFLATSTPWILSSVGVVVDGKVIPKTFSLPTASQDRYAESVESIPPLKPIIIPSVLDSDTFDLINSAMSFFVFLQFNSGISLIFSPTLSSIHKIVCNY